jgi:hypothetical protein
MLTKESLNFLVAQSTVEKFSHNQLHPLLLGAGQCEIFELQVNEWVSAPASSTFSSLNPKKTL